MKKIRFVVLILLCVSMILPSCSNKPGNTGGETQESGENITAVPEEMTEPEPEFPAKDMNGKEFKIITAGWWDAAIMEIRDICPEEYTGEPLNDSAYDRKLKIEEKYNCKVTQIAGSYEPNDDLTRVQKSVQSGTHIYDVAMMRGINFTGLLTKNYLLELGELQNIDFENSWWRKKCSDALRIGGKRYGVSGNISTVEISLGALICFNKSIVKNYGLESPYELVKTGDWTLDKLAEMSKKVAHDLNGDGKMTDADMWGISYDRDRVWNLLNSCGINLMGLDADGFPRITLDEGENIYKIQNVLTVLFDESYSANARRISVGFTTERVLFRFDWANGVVDLRSYDVDFGIIPFPKYNKEQPEYLSNVYGLGVPIICVPTTNTDMENTGLFMEAFSYEGQKRVIPVFYENILKTKVTRDDESADMIDYIFGNLQYDTGTLLNFDDFTQRICEMAETLNTNIASFVEKNKPKCEKAVQKIMDAIEKENSK